MRAFGISILAVAAVAGTALGLQSSASAQSNHSRVFDRTLLGTTLVQAGVREIDVRVASVAPGQRDFDGQKALAAASLGTGGPTSSSPPGPVVGGATLVGARAGPARRSGGSYFLVSNKQCKPSGQRVSLSPRGLDGGPASPFGDAVECVPPRTILVRARAVFASPTRLRLERSSGSLVTSKAVREASFAARTLSGKPLAYAEISESGKARLFTAPSCVPD